MDARKKARTVGQRMQSACRLAVRKMGGQSETARRLTKAAGRRISRQAVGQWSKVPDCWLLIVERLSGVPREQLRPDLAALSARK
jgi:hypothetical protein